MEHKTEKITPAKAEQYLNRNHSNRKLRNGVAEKYAQDMKGNCWTQCVAPIVFYENGDVADGQHRLWAIVESETTQEFIVVRGLAREAGLNIDTGLSRTLVDNARISGVDEDLSNQMISYARAIQLGDRSGKNLSNSAKLEVVNRHREVAKWLISNGPKGRILHNSMTMAAVGRAWYYETDHEKLRRFCDVLTSGFSDGNQESAAIAIRNYLIAKGSVVTSAGLWRDTFLKTMNAIKNFMVGKPVVVIKAVSEEVYPWPIPRKAKK